MHTFLYELEGYNFICKNRVNKKGGGVAIYLRKGIEFSERDDLAINVEGEFESIFIEVDIKTNPKLIVGEVYRVPNSNGHLSINRYKDIISKMDLEKKDLILGTDQNYDFIKIDQHKNTEELFTAFLTHSILPTINKPTRINHRTATLIDNIYVKVKNKDKQIIPGILTNDISDHQPLILVIKGDNINKTKINLKIKVRKMNDINIALINEALLHQDWTMLNHLNTNQSYDKFIEVLKCTMDKIAPEKEITIPKKKIIRNRWMTPGLLKSSQTRLKLYRKCITSNRQDPKYIKYTKYRNLFNSMKRKTKFEYYSKLIKEHANDMRKTWRVLNTMIGKTNNKNEISDKFIINNNVITNPNTISEEFCKYFTEVGDKLASNIPKSKHSYEEHNTRPRNPRSIYISPTDTNEITKIISMMKSKNSSGHDNLNSILIKQIKHSISTPLTIIANKSLEHGEIPQNMKIAKIIPIYKAKDRKQLNNYRPISLLPCLSKILEKIMHKRVYHFMLLNDQFYKSQYGFRPCHNTVHAVTEFCHSVFESFENKETTLAVFLDLSKAFDTIDHKILLSKLDRYGIRGRALEWFRNYLSNRLQYVKYKNSTSPTMSMVNGVPQGSVLGPLLFIIYSNDIPSSLSQSKAIMFADDTTIYHSGKNIIELFNVVNNDLNKLTDWFRANKLSLNIGKTNYIIFNNTKHMVFDNNLNLILDNQKLQNVDSTKFLGIIIDKHLNWTEHIKHIKVKMARGTYAINSLKFIIPIKLLKVIYHSIIHSYLTYGILLWGSATQTKLKPLETAQKRAIRSIGKLKYNDPSLPMFKQLEIIKLTEIYKTQLNSLMYDQNNNTLPKSLNSIFTRNSQVHSHNTRRIDGPHVVARRLKIVSDSFICRGPEYWNTLPDYIKECRTKKSFKTKMKKWFISNY